MINNAIKWVVIFYFTWCNNIFLLMSDVQSPVQVSSSRSTNATISTRDEKWICSLLEMPFAVVVTFRVNPFTFLYELWFPLPTLTWWNGDSARDRRRSSRAARSFPLRRKKASAPPFLSPLGSAPSTAQATHTPWEPWKYPRKDIAAWLGKELLVHIFCNVKEHEMIQRMIIKATSIGIMNK